MSDDEIAVDGVWETTRAWSNVCSEPIIAIADDACGNIIFLCYDTSPPCVRFCMHEGEEMFDVAPSFSDFIDSLIESPYA